MTGGTVSKVVSACCGLSGFAVAVIAGLAADNAGDVILLRALISMVACQIVGLIVGMIIERVVVESVESYKQSKPVGPSQPAELSSPAPPNTGAAAS